MFRTSPSRYRSLLFAGGSLTAYAGAALLLGRIAPDPVIGAALLTLPVAVIAAVYRRTAAREPHLAPSAGFSRSEWFWPLVVVGVISSWGLGTALSTWVSSSGVRPQPLNGVELVTPGPLVVLIVIVLVPISEELLFRGVLYPSLRGSLSVVPAALVSAALFAVLHGNLAQILLVFPFAVILAGAYEASRRLWVVIAMHIAFNVASSTPALVRLIRPESAAVWIVLTIGAAALLLRGAARGELALKGSSGSADPEGVREQV